MTNSTPEAIGKIGTPAVCSTDLLSVHQTLKGLRYIAASPPEKYGGFHAETVRIAKSALWHMKLLDSDNDKGQAGRENPDV